MQVSHLTYIYTHTHIYTYIHTYIHTSLGELAAAHVILQNIIKRDSSIMEAHLLVARLYLHQDSNKQCSSSLELALSSNFAVIWPCLSYSFFFLPSYLPCPSSSSPLICHVLLLPPLLFAMSFFFLPSYLPCPSSSSPLICHVLLLCPCCICLPFISSYFPHFYFRPSLCSLHSLPSVPVFSLFLSHFPSLPILLSSLP